MNKMNDMTRREFLRNAGKVALGAAIATSIPLSGVASGTEEVKKWPWKYVQVDKDQLLDRLWNMMVKEDVTDPMLIQVVCAEKGYYDASVPVNEYDMEFIEGCLIEAWDKVLGLVLTKKEDLPF